MLSKENEFIQKSLAHIGKISGKVSVVFKIALAIVALFAALFFGISLVGAFAPDLLPFTAIPFDIRLISTLLSIMITCIVLYAIAVVFEDISLGNSPFTLAQAKRIGFIGWLLIVGVVLDAIISPDATFMMNVAGFDLGYVASVQDYPGLFINGHYLIEAIVCFCLSYAFKYGALLQQLSDDTV